MDASLLPKSLGPLMGGGGGGLSYPMSILRKGNMPCHYNLNSLVHFKNPQCSMTRESGHICSRLWRICDDFNSPTVKSISQIHITNPFQIDIYPICWEIWLFVNAKTSNSLKFIATLWFITSRQKGLFWRI